MRERRMKQKIKSSSVVAESVVVFVASAPLLIISLGMIIVFLFLFWGNIGFVPDFYEMLCYLAVAMFIPTMVFDILAIVRFSKSLGSFKWNKIKSYQNRVRAFLDLYVILGCLFLSNVCFLLAEEDVPFVAFFIFLTIIPLLLVTWRFRKNTAILKELIIEDIKQKRGI
jgi:hypothetical protein